MKYSIFGFNQTELLNNGISVEEALILERLVWLSGIYPEKIIDGKGYKWISYSRLRSEIPIICTSDNKIKRYMASLESKNLIERVYIKGNNMTKVYFYFTDKVKLLTGQIDAVTKNTGNRPELTGQVTGQNCTVGNRPELADESSGNIKTRIEPTGICAAHSVSNELTNNTIIDNELTHKQIIDIFDKLYTKLYNDKIQWTINNKPTRELSSVKDLLTIMKDESIREKINLFYRYCEENPNDKFYKFIPSFVLYQINKLPKGKNTITKANMQESMNKMSEWTEKLKRGETL
jgi:hypothetical protein